MTNFANTVRRRDRQKTDPAFLLDLLKNCPACTIAVEKNGFPFIHVAFFVFDEANDEIIFHFSKHGYAGEEITNGKKAAISSINMANCIPQRRPLTLDVNIKV